MSRTYQQLLMRQFAIRNNVIIINTIQDLENESLGRDVLPDMNVS